MAILLDLAQLPFPIAYPLHWARDPSLSLRDRRDNAIFAGYQAMRLAALLMLADYLALDESEPVLASRIRGLRLPHWAEWSLLADELARFWAAPKRKARAHFPQVVEGWVSVSRVRLSAGGKTPPLDPSWQPLIAGFEGLGGCSQARSANEALWALRNLRAHGEATITADADTALGAEVDRLAALVEAIVTRLYGAGGFVLLRRVKGEAGTVRVIRLAGAHADLAFAGEAIDPEWEAALAPTQVAALTETEAVPVYPLLVPTDEDRGPTGLVEPVEPAMMVDSVSSTRLTLLGVKRLRNVTEPHLAAVLDKLKSKHTELTLERQEVKPWTVDAWARMTARQTLAELEGRKYFPWFYLERPDVDGRVAHYATQSGRALLLLGEAGAGKSSLIARHADRLTGAPEDAPADAAQQIATADEDEGDIVVFLAGRADYGGAADASADRLLVECVARKLGIADGAFANLAELVRHLGATAPEDANQGRLLWLLLDGVNEADRFADLVRAIDALLPVLAEAPRARLVMSMRSGAFHALAARDVNLGAHGPRVFSHAERLLSFPDAQGCEHSWLEVRTFHAADEGPQAYALRRDRLSGRATAIPYELLPPGLRQLLLTPLYLHLFHEAWAGRETAPADLDEGQLLDAYLDRLAGGGEGSLGGAGEWMLRLAELMLTTRRAFLPVAEAARWADEWRAAHGFSSVLAAVKLDPVEELVAASVLLRPAETSIGLARDLAGYQFTQQKLAERILVRALDRRIAPRTLPSRDELAHWAQHAAAPTPFAELTGALRDWVARLTHAGDGEALTALLDIVEDGTRARLLGEIIFASAGAPAAAAEAVLLRLVTDRRDRFYLSTVEAVARLDEAGGLPGRRRVWQAMLLRAERLAAMDPGNAGYQRDLSSSFSIMGNLAVAERDSAAARDWFGKSLEIRERLTATDHGNNLFNLYQNDLSVSYNQMGDLAVAAGDGRMARTWFGKSLAIRQRLAAADPGNPLYQRGRVLSCTRIGDVVAGDGDQLEAIEWFTQAVTLIEQLAARDPSAVLYRNDLAYCRQRLAELADDEGATSPAGTSAPGKWWQRLISG